MPATFDQIVAQRLSRRQLLKGAAGAALVGFMSVSGRRPRSATIAIRRQDSGLIGL